jgi:hypothetical protein
MRLIKIKIGNVYTRIWYRKSKFRSRREAMEAAISHLKIMLGEKIE